MPTTHDNADSDPARIDATQCLVDARGGDASAAQRLDTLVYQSLRELAGRYIGQRGGAALTIQPTALVHEAYLRLIQRDVDDFAGRTHFFAVAAVAMRHVLVDHLRARGRQKRGGGWGRVTLASVEDADQAPIDVLALHEAISELAKSDERAARVVVMRFFSGLSEDEIADTLGVSSRTVRNDWRMARAWLRCALDDTDRAEAEPE